MEHVVFDVSLKLTLMVGLYVTRCLMALIGITLVLACSPAPAVIARHSSPKEQGGGETSETVVKISLWLIMRPNTFSTCMDISNMMVLSYNQLLRTQTSKEYWRTILCILEVMESYLPKTQIVVFHGFLEQTEGHGWSSGGHPYQRNRFETSQTGFFFYISDCS